MPERDDPVKNRIIQTETKQKEWVRLAMHADYQVKLGEDGQALAYSDLNYRYQEETVWQGSRGLILAKKSLPEILKIQGKFATLDFAYIPELALEKGLDPKLFPFYLLEARMIPNVANRSKFAKCKALPEERNVETEKVEKTRKQGALIKHLLGDILRNFEIDTIRAAIGNIDSSQDLEQKKDLLLKQLRKWEPVKAIPKQKESENPKQTDPMTLKRVRTLYSPVLKDALRQLSVVNL